MEIAIKKTGEKKTLSFSGKLGKLLEKLSINRETVLVVKNNELITEDATLEDKDSIEIIDVVSGG